MNPAIEFLGKEEAKTRRLMSNIVIHSGMPSAFNRIRGGDNRGAIT